MLIQEICGAIEDALARPLSPDRTMTLVLDRVNGPDSEEVLAAALTVAREQAERIAVLEQELSESEDRIAILEEDAEELRDHESLADFEYAPQGQEKS